MDMINLGAAAAAAAMRSGEVSAERYADVLLQRCREFEALHAFLAIDRDGVLAAARAADQARRAGARLGPLHGLPLAVKDNVDVAGLPTSCNSPQLAGPAAAADAAVVRTLRSAGALMLGKANMPELALLGSLNRQRTDGAAVNPYAPGHMTGGSSSGTAVAVAARLAPAGIGTDTGGSVRIPASHCGIAGLRPTLGRYPSEGMVVLCPTRDTAGPMARSVGDLALLDAAITGDHRKVAPARLERVRLGVPRAYFHEDLDPETAAFAARQLDRLRAAGATLIEADVADVERLNDKVSFPVYLHEIQHRLAAYVAERLPRTSLADFAAGIASPGCRSLVLGLLGSAPGPFPPPSLADYQAAITVHRPALREAYRSYFATHGVAAIVYPTTPLPARSLDERETVMLNGRPRTTMLIYVRSTDPASNAGIPSVSVPGELSTAGVPLGLAFDGPLGSDRRLLSIASAYEAIRPALPAPTLPARSRS
jgi:mandelamide amidase